MYNEQDVRNMHLNLAGAEVRFVYGSAHCYTIPVSIVLQESPGPFDVPLVH